MPFPSELTREIDRRAYQLGWSSDELATELGIDRTTLAHIRAGRRHLSLHVLGKIAARFGDRQIQRLTWLYIAVELGEEETWHLPSPPRSLAPSQVAALGRKTVEALRGYIANFPERLVTGQGLCLVGPNGRSLSAAIAYLQHAFSDRRIPVVRVMAKDKPTASLARDGLEAPLLLIDRIGYVSAGCSDLIRARLKAAKPVVASYVDGLGKGHASIIESLCARGSRLVVDAPTPDLGAA